MMTAAAKYAAVLPGYKATVVFPGAARYPLGLEVTNVTARSFAYYEEYVVRCALTGEITRRFSESEDAEVLAYLAGLAA